MARRTPLPHWLIFLFSHSDEGLSGALEDVPAYHASDSFLTSASLRQSAGDWLQQTTCQLIIADKLAHPDGP